MKHDDQLEVILSVLRHELGNSVNAVKITLDVLQENFDHFDDQKKRVYLERGSVLLERQNALVQALKSYSKFNASSAAQVDILTFWERFVEEARNLAAQHNANLKVSSDLTARHIVGDSLALGKILDFILENALEALPRDKSGRIELAAAEQDRHIALTVSDNGRGMDEDHLSKAVIPLFTTKPDKMGMGLPIVLKLLREMGGQLDIDSTPEKGTRVRIQLPKIDNSAAQS